MSDPFQEIDPAILDPFRQIFGRTFYKVDSVAGSWKTTTAMDFAVAEAAALRKTIIAMPTQRLIDETIKVATKVAKDRGVDIKPVMITIANTKPPIPDAIVSYIGTAAGGQILFVTHEGLLRVLDWPEQVKEWHLIIDEVFDPLLSTGLLKLRYSHFNLGLRPGKEHGAGFIHAVPLLTTLGQEGSEKEYYHITPNLKPEHDDIWSNIQQHIYGQENDQVYALFKQLPLWLLQREALFTHVGNWNHMMGLPNDRKPTMRKGNITIGGFRRPDRFLEFRRVTIMSALFESTMLHNLWSRLGIQFQPSPDIPLNVKTVPLGSRRLRIGWLTDDAWSKNRRKNSGGIQTIFDIIAKSGLIDRKQQVGLVINKDDEHNLDVITSITKAFPRHKVLPHNVRGSNIWTHLNQLIHTAALNSPGSDIVWTEKALGIDSMTQRLARLGHEIYQTLMRLSIRVPDSNEDIVVVVMEKTIAEWLVNHFTPHNQVELIQIDNEGRIPKLKPVGRPRSGKSRKEQNAESSRRYRQKKKQGGASA